MAITYPRWFFFATPPKKPTVPSKTIFKSKKIKELRFYNEFDTSEIPENTKAISINIETDSYGSVERTDAVFFDKIEIPNSEYEKQIKIYEEELKKYEERLPEWTKYKEIYDKDQAEKQKNMRRNQYNELKKEFENEIP